MLTVFKGWIERFFSDEEALIFLIILISSFAIIIGFGMVLAPVFIAIILAYLLPGFNDDHVCFICWDFSWGIAGCDTRDDFTGRAIVL